MLGELYYPKGKAKETASEVLDVKEPMACNLAYGCSNACSYCVIGNTIVKCRRRKKFIKNINIGNEIISFDGKCLVYNKVIKIYKREIDPSELLMIKFEDNTKIICTKEHPFYINGIWKIANDLKIGEECWHINSNELRSFFNKNNNPMLSEENRKKVSLSKIGINNPNWKPKIKLNCIVCGKEFEVKPCRKNAKCCSKICKYNIFSNYMKYNNPMKIKEIREMASKKRKGIPNLKNRGRKRPDFSRYLLKNNPMKDIEIKKRALWKLRNYRPTNIERKIIEIAKKYNLPIKYVGNYALWIGDKEHKLNPDFIVNNQKKLIEVYDPNNGIYDIKRGKNWEEKRYTFFEKYGYKTLFLKLSLRGTLKPSEEELLNEIRNFISNGLKIIEIRMPNRHELIKSKENGKLFVYNLHCEPNENYLITRTYSKNCLIVHNCYIPYIKKGQIRFPKVPPIDLVRKQIDKGLKPEGVFLSFTTDPFLKENEENTNNLIGILLENKIKVATLSKVGVPKFEYLCGTRTGMTIVSDSEDFRRKFEPNAITINIRIRTLKSIHDMGGFTWVSLEPYPTPALWKQKLESVLDKINFVDFMIFGKWNYEILANDKPFYAETIRKFEDYCNSMGIKHFVKTESR